MHIDEILCMCQLNTGSIFTVYNVYLSPNTEHIDSTRLFSC